MRWGQREKGEERSDAGKAKTGWGICRGGGGGDAV